MKSGNAKKVSVQKPDKALWKSVRDNYFPYFDRKNEWRLKVGSKTSISGEEGFCDSDNKTIYVSPAVATGGEDAFAVVLIHELTHAVLGDGSHGKRFQQRLEKAAQQAKKIGQNLLATAIMGEIKSYSLLEEQVTVQNVYQDMQEIVQELSAISFSAALKLLEQRYPRTLLQNRQKLREIFKESQRTAR